jgi:hypothetical protein
MKEVMMENGEDIKNREIEEIRGGVKLRRRHILSGNAIKVMGIILMTADHLHQMFAPWGAPDWVTWLGRPVAPLFLFLCAEGYAYTRSRKDYMLRLLAGFLFMTLINRLLSRFMPLEFTTLINNIFGTLFLAVFYMWTLDLMREGVREKKPGKVLLAAGGILLSLLVSIAFLAALAGSHRTAALILLFIPSPVSVEGGFVLVFLGTAFYLLRKYRAAQIGLLLAVGAVTWYFSRGSGDMQYLMAAAALPIFLYNGRRGRGGRGSKYFFYIFYPAHIYLFYIIAWFLSTGG